MKKAVIACNVFYTELARLADGWDMDVVLMPQGLHNYADSEKMKAAIQAKINELESEKDYDFILLAYGLCSGGVEGLTGRRAGLVITLAHDCIPLLLGKPAGLDDGATYYLSRGWIDCGGDSYKEHLYMMDQLGRLFEKFDRYRQDTGGAMVLWQEKDQYRQPSRKYSPEIAEMITYELLKNYRSLTLIDNENLEPFHLEYAREMYEFLCGLLIKTRGEGVEFIVKKGDPVLLKKLLFFDRLDPQEQKKLFLITAPGEPLNLRKQLLKH